MKYKFKDEYISGAKRANLQKSDWLGDWFWGYGKDDGCCFEGTWWDMICFARNVLASENTKDLCPEFYHPEMKNNHYNGNPPYDKIKE